MHTQLRCLGIRFIYKEEDSSTFQNFFIFSRHIMTKTLRNDRHNIEVSHQNIPKHVK